MPRSALRSARTRAPSTCERSSGMNRHLQCLGTNLFDEPFFQPDEFGRGLDLVGSRVRQIDHDLCLDGAVTCDHDYDTAAEEDLIFDILGVDQLRLLDSCPVV